MLRYISEADWIQTGSYYLVAKEWADSPEPPTGLVPATVKKDGRIAGGVCRVERDQTPQVSESADAT